MKYVVFLHPRRNLRNGFPGYGGGKFDAPEVAPLKQLDDQTYVMELFHGPTLAFKDMALQLLPHLITLSAKKNGEEREISILVALSAVSNWISNCINNRIT